LLEKVTEEVAVGCGVMISDACHVSVEDIARYRAGLEVAGGAHGRERAAQAFEDKLIDEASAVVADVEDDAFLADLREVLLYEGVEAGVAHVGDVDIADLAAAQLIDFLTVALDHIELVQVELVGDGLD